MTNELTIRRERFLLPEGFTYREHRAGFSILDERGWECSLFYQGFRPGDDRPYLMTSVQTGNRLIALNKANPTDQNTLQKGAVNKTATWHLSLKLLKILIPYVDQESDLKEKISIVEKELTALGDAEMKDYVMNRLQVVINEYRKTKVWNFTLLAQ